MQHALKQLSLTALMAIIATALLMAIPQDASAKKVKITTRINNIFSEVLNGSKVFKKSDRVVFPGGIGVPSSTKAFVNKLNVTGRIMNSRAGLPVKIKDALLVTGNATLEGTVDFAGYNCDTDQFIGYDGSAWVCQDDDVEITLGEGETVTGGTGITVNEDGEISLSERTRTIQLPLMSWLVDTGSNPGLVSTSSIPALAELASMPTLEWPSGTSKVVYTTVTVPSDYVAGSDVVLNFLLTSGVGTDTANMNLEWASFVSGNSAGISTATQTESVTDSSNLVTQFQEVSFTLTPDDDAEADQIITAGETMMLRFNPSDLSTDWSLSSVNMEYSAK